MLIGDLTGIHSRSVLADPLSASLTEIRDAFLPTQEALRLCARIVHRAGTPGRKPGGIILCGSPGTGKSHVVRYAEALLASPGDPGWDALAPFLGAEQLTSAPVRTLVLPIPADPAVDLPQTLSLPILTHAGDLPLVSRMSAEQFGALISDAAPRLLSRSVGVVVLEDLSRRLNGSQGAGRAQADVECCTTLARILSEHGILVVVTAAHSSPNTLEHSPLAPLAAFCEVIPVSRRNLAEAIFALTDNTEAQRDDIRAIVERLRRSLPLLGSKTDDSVKLYPFHPPLFQALFIARRFRADFAPLQFAVAALKASREWPADRLITLDVLFDYLMPQLRADEQVGDYLSAFYECEHEVLSELSPDVVPKATALLKAIAFGTVCGNRERSVRWLAEQVLPGEQSGFGSAYSTACALLAEVERCCRGKVSARGGGIERTYGLLAQDSVDDRNDARRESLRLRFPLMVCDWIHTEIPCWNPEFSAKYLRHSQTLMTAPPDGQSDCKGVVHFQSAFERLWSDEDVWALKESGAEWALLIVPPFERLQDLEHRVRSITQEWDRVLVWRPDMPNMSELRVLRKIATAYSIPARGGARWRKSRAKARRLLRTLYVRRGLLLTANDHWSPSAELEDDSVASVLSRAILSLPGLAPAQPAAVQADAGPAPSDKVLAWAALLLDSAVRPESEVLGERHLLSWWATRLEVDCSALISRLHSLPETFTTTRMGEEIRFFESSLGLIRSALQRLRNRELSFPDAIGQIAAHFGNDESRLLKWRKSLDNFAGLSRWLPTYEYARDYVEGAFDTGKPDIDERRITLLEACGHPHRMLEAGHRDAFDAGFLQFKKLYAEAYSSLHEEAIGRIQMRVDPVAVRTLELLSRLQYADTTWFQKVQLIAKWARSNQCDLPVRAILDRYPRCYCNFNPSIRQHVVEPVARINRLVQEGMEYFRSSLRNCRKTIIDELVTLRAGDEIGRQIASLLSRGPAMPIDADTVELLNTITQKHPDQFRSELRSQRKQPARSTNDEVTMKEA